VRDAKPDFIPSKPFIYKGRVHLQIDEKYVGDASSSKKKRYMTATIFTGEMIVPGGGRKIRKKLLNRTIVSSFDISLLAKKINQALIDLYGITADDTIWLSGDLANYIRNFPERITCCTAIYVPDKWHVCKFLSEGTDKTIGSHDVKRYLDHLLETGDISNLTDEGMKVMNLYMKNREIFKPWRDKRYLGCCQEGMNSHYYAPRFGKYANRFNESTLEKLASIKEAKENGWKTILSSKSRRPRESNLIPLGKEYPETMKFDIDTSEMKYESRKYFDTVRYGD